MRVKAVLAGVGLALVAVLPAHASVVFSDSFENPSLAGGYSYGGTDTAGAQFFPASANPDYNGAGIQANGSAFGYQAAPDGIQTAFIQGTGSFVESVTGLTAGNTYTLSFFAAARPGYALDSVQASYTPMGLDPILLTASPSSTSWTSYSASFTSQGDGTFTFAGLNTGSPSNDVNIGLDAVSISTGGVPETSTWIMMLLGFGGLGVFAYRRKMNGTGHSLIAA